MSRHLKLKNYLGKDQAWHFSRIELGPIHRKTLHVHDFSELFWIESGKGIHWIHGRKRTIGPGSLIFVRPEDYHTVGTATANDTMVICNLAFATSRWRSVHHRLLDRRAPWFRPGPPEQREHAVGPRSFAFLRQAGPDMLAAPRTPLRLERFFLNLAVMLEESQSPPPSGAPSWLADALEKVEKEGLFREGPQALTRLAHRSQEHVVREAKRWLQKTPTALINEMRMRQAARGLGTTRTEIIDICYDCGLENLGHFYALFQQYHGMTPRRYRLMSQSIVRSS